MVTCPECGEDALDVRRYESLGFESYVHETDDLGPFTEITESCYHDLE